MHACMHASRAVRPFGRVASAVPRFNCTLLGVGHTLLPANARINIHKYPRALVSGKHFAFRRPRAVGLSNLRPAVAQS
jgi:hypothetical protein